MNLSTEKLKSMRSEKGWSQFVLAKASGLSVRTIQRIESDGKASAESTLAIASVFEITPAELKAISNEVHVSWNRSVIMKNVIAILVLSATIGLLILLGGSIEMFVNIPVVLFLILFVNAATIMSFGTHGMHKSIISLKYLFTDELKGGEEAKYLAKLYCSQVVYAYAGAAVALTIGSISILGAAGQMLAQDIYRGLSINLLALLYTVIVNEGLIRPLSVKFKTCDMTHY